MKDRILDLFKRNPERTFSPPQILNSLMLVKSERRDVKDALHELEEEGRVERVRGRVYTLRSRKQRLTGRVDLTRAGHAFIIPANMTRGQADIYIHKRNLESAMDGDLVAVRVFGERDGRLEGAVDEVVERRHKVIVGRLMKNARGGLLIPRNRKVDRTVELRRTPALDEAPDEAWIEAEIDHFPKAPEPLSGTLKQVLGLDGDKGLDIFVIIRDFGVETEYPKEAEAAAARLESPTDADLAGRDDFRTSMTFTIDGDTAKDFDDALSIEKRDGGWRIGVHIADVAHYVRPEDPIDIEAVERATSIYPIDRVVPMLPERLSNGLCSLRPNEDRLTLSAIIDLDKDANVVGSRLANGVIHSNFRLTYDKVQRLLDGKSDADVEEFAPAHGDVKTLWKLAQVLTAKRMERGAIDLDVPEPEIVFGERGEVADVRWHQRPDSMKLIEEFMLLANEVVAQTLTREGWPTLFRVHDPPNPDKVDRVAPLLAAHGVPIGGADGSVTQAGLQLALDRAKDKPNAHVLRYLILRSMMQAKYQPANVGHFGLASECYCHFTSPIRRYPDLIVHRAVKRLIAGERLNEEARDEMDERLKHLGDWCSDRERRSESIERECFKVKALEFMSDKLGMEFDAWIVGLNPAGFFVELSPNPVEGFVPLENLDDDYYEYIEEEFSHVGRNTGKRYKFGDQLRVIIRHVDMIALRMEVLPVDAYQPVSPRSNGKSKTKPTNTMSPGKRKYGTPEGRKSRRGKKGRKR